MHDAAAMGAYKQHHVVAGGHLMWWHGPTFVSSEPVGMLQLAGLKAANRFDNRDGNAFICSERCTARETHSP